MAGITAMNRVDRTFTEAELEFLAEDELVTIVPNFRGAALNLMQVTAGPFVPQVPTSVPIWLALALHQRKRCSVQWPTWMSTAELSRVLAEERGNEREFQKLPFHYVEMAQLLIDTGHGENTEERYKVRSLLEDVRRVRFNKVEKGLQELRQTPAVKLNNLCAMEVNIVRTFFQTSLKTFAKLAASSDAQAAAT
jgi:GINS complex subunit 2